MQGQLYNYSKHKWLSRKTQLQRRLRDIRCLMFLSRVVTIILSATSWFIENFERYNDTKLIIADFGIMNYPDGDYTYIDMSKNKHKVGSKNLQL